jgi:hypothetical protein
MADRVLTLRDLNRATLDRQMLLAQADMPVLDALQRLAGLQAQQPSSPYIALWTRLQGFRRADLAGPIHDRTAVKATTLRATLHLGTAADYLRFRATLQPALTAGWSAIAKRRAATFDLSAVLDAATDFIAAQPRTFAAISALLAARWPDQDIGAMRYAVRTHLPLVQTPVTGGWSYPGNPKFALAEAWIGRPVASEDHLPELILRYLAAFGPAAATDMQTWSGLGKLSDVCAALKPQLQTYRDERRRELYDLPGLPLPDPDRPAPVRFLPEYDSLLLAHHNRTRVVADEHRKRVYLPGLRVAATILVDGFVAGAWTIETVKKRATLVIEPFTPLDKQTQTALIEEGEQLVRFVEPQATGYAVRFAA